MLTTFLLPVLYVIAGLLVLLILISLMNCLAGPFLFRPAKGQTLPPVSVLIPARNEERSIERCLQTLLDQDYPEFEIIVLNDNSIDSTAERVGNLARRDERVRLVNGSPLPAGWTGKNWACHQLSRHARHDILIFTDADNYYASHAVLNTVRRMLKHKLGFLSAFPQQITSTIAEKLVIPVIDMFVYALLPLWGTFWSRSPRLACANGQWICFTRDAYQLSGGHQRISKEIVEDIELSRQVRLAGVRSMTVAGTGVVFGRMYSNAAEVWAGFSKNLFGISGNSLLRFAALFAALFSVCVLPYVLLLSPPVQSIAVVLVGLNILLRAILSIRFHHPFFTSIVLHPVGVLFVLAIGLNSVRQVLRGSVVWKERTIATD